ncbi:MAG: hypothetical protein AAFV53_42665 [Myxococcota bacterium]
MSIWNRRGFLRDMLMGTAGASMPLSGMASETDRVAAHAAHLRTVWEMQREGFVDGMFAQVPEMRQGEALDTTRIIGDGLGAMEAFKEIERLSVEEQTHPAFQALTLDVASSLGQATRVNRDLMERFLSGHDTDEGEGYLRSALHEVHQAVQDWPTSADRRRRLGFVLDQTLADASSGALRRQIRGELRRIRRLERLSIQIYENWDHTGVLSNSNPMLRRRVKAAHAHWQAQGLDPLRTRPSTPAVILGILIIGVALVAGSYIAIAGLCAALCGAPEGILVLLLGVGIIALGIWGGIAVMKASSNRQQREGDPQPALEPTQPQETVRLYPGDWMKLAFARSQSVVITIKVSGQINGPDWVSGAIGHPVPAHPDAMVPRFPLGAVLGRIGTSNTEIVLVGERYVLLPGEPAPFFLAINSLIPSQKEFYTVTVITTQID